MLISRGDLGLPPIYKQAVKYEHTHSDTHTYLDIDVTKAKSLVWPVVSMHLQMRSLQDFEVWPVHSDA